LRELREELAGVATTFFLVRHAAHALLDRVMVGRMPGVGIGEVGRAQAQRVACRLTREGIELIQSSPQQRTRETADPVAERIGLPAVIEPALDEIDLGEWTGQPLDQLEADPRWRTWNDSRSIARVPGGESMGEVQARVLGHLGHVRRNYPEGRVAMVSHGDVIKAAILFYLGLPLDAFNRFEISPASLSTVVVGDWGSKILALNEVPAG
jgi:probable phosphoglycerate mutase